MNKLILILTPLLIGVLSSSLKAQKLAFSYDVSGNQTERRWLCVNCPSTKSMMIDNSQKSVNPSDLDIENGKRAIKAYPNPVMETLNVSWYVSEKLYLKHISVYNIMGNRVHSSRLEPGQNQTQISLQRLPPGTYLLIGEYSDAKTESIKLIKL